MAELDSRFMQLVEQQRQAAFEKDASYMSPEAMDDSDLIPQQLINDLIFNQLPSSNFPGSGMPSFFPIGHPLAMHMVRTTDSPEGARIHTLASTHKPRENSGDHTLTWGSEVELPSGTNNSPPKSRNFGPTINVQPPTESNARTRLASIPSRTDPRTPFRTEIDLMEEQIIPGSGMAEKSLPDTPEAKGQSVRSTAPSPEDVRGGGGRGRGEAADYFDHDQYRQDLARSNNTTPTIQQNPPRAPRSAAGNGNNIPHHRSTERSEISPITQDAVTAPTHITQHYPTTDSKRGQDIIHVREAVEPVLEMGPWDHVTQRLYAWALVWEDETFTKALESLALGKQVEVMPLTVFSMMTYKR